MGRTERKRTVTRDDVLNAFNRRSDPSEPLTTAEVADTLGCSRRATRELLDTLAEQGDLATKEMGNQARVWWQPTATALLVARQPVQRVLAVSADLRRSIGGAVRNAALRLNRVFRTVLADKYPSGYSERFDQREERNMTTPAADIDPDDPFWETSGMLSSDRPSDVSSSVDAYLYGKRDIDSDE